MRIRRIHHVTLAVRALDEARATFAALFGASAEPGDVVDAFGVRTADVPLGDDVLQLAAPLEPGAPLTRFLDRKGEGFYNIAIEVEDLDEAVAELTRNGVRVSDPIEATPGVRSAFIAASATHGLSVQLMESTRGGDAEAVDAPGPSLRADDNPAASAESDAPDGASDNAPAEAPRLLDLTPDEWSDVD